MYKYFRNYLSMCFPELFLRFVKVILHLYKCLFISCNLQNREISQLWKFLYEFIKAKKIKGLGVGVEHRG